MIAAVIFDLFGTLVDAPTSQQRNDAVASLARATELRDATLDDYLTTSWMVRHNGTLPTVVDMAHHLITQTGSSASATTVAAAWREFALPRLVPDASVMGLLEDLRGAGVLVGLISDASPEIAEAWTSSSLADLVDHAVFSCTAGAVKPDPSLYGRALSALGVRPRDVLYIGDGGGDELNGAVAVGLTALRVVRRGGADALVFGETTSWQGGVLNRVEDLPKLLHVGGRA